MAVVRPEIELLLCCARTRLCPQTAERIGNLLAGGLDWVELIRAGLLHGMLPLLYHNARSLCPGAVPADTFQQLRRYFENTADRNLRLARELVRVIGLLQAHSIPAATFKGPALAAVVYGDLALREFYDLDILVHPGTAVRARSVLLEHGYKENRPQRTDWVRSGKEKNFLLLSDDDRTTVELHWQFTSRNFPFPLEMQALWPRLEPVTLAGNTISTVPLDALLVFLCMHGCRHQWGQLKWVCDIGEITRHGDKLDWDGVAIQARKLGAERMLYIGLLLAADLLDAEVPPPVLRKVAADPMAAFIAARIRRRFRNGGDLLQDVEKWALHLWMRERLRDRVRVLFSFSRMLPTAEDHRAVRLPGPLSFLYYPIRLARLMRSCGRYLLVSTKFGLSWHADSE